MPRTLIAFAFAIFILLAIMTTAFMPSIRGQDQYDEKLYTQVNTIGSNRAGIGEFNGPTGIATDSSGNLYVVDSGNKRVQKFSSNGTLLTLLYPEDIGISSVVVAAMAFDSEDNLYLAMGNTIGIFEPNNLDPQSATDGDNNSISTKYYQTPTKIMDGLFTFVPSSSDVRVVCGSVNTIEKIARFELLTDSVHNDLSGSNTIELILPDEFISGIYRIEADDGREIQFEQWELDNKDTSLLDALDLSSDRNYTTVKFAAPENALFIDIYATTVVPEFGTSLAIVILTITSISAIVIASRYTEIRTRK